MPVSLSPGRHRTVYLTASTLRGSSDQQRGGVVTVVIHHALLECSARWRGCKVRSGYMSDADLALAHTHSMLLDLVGQLRRSRRAESAYLPDDT